MKIITRLVIGLIFIFIFTGHASASQFVSFAPMEDSRFSFRTYHSGVNIEPAKPYMESFNVDDSVSEDNSSFNASAVTFTRLDIILFGVLLGGYIMLTRKKANTRSAGF